MACDIATLMLDEAAIERLRIAVKVLNSPYNHNEQVTDAEIETLKSYLDGDFTNLSTKDIATAVIRRELDLESKGSRKRKDQNAFNRNGREK